MSFGSGYTPSAYNYERSVKLNNKLHANVKIPGGNQASASYITTGTASNDLRGLSISSYSIDNAIGLIKSIDATAEVIEKKLKEMKTLETNNSGSTFKGINKLQEPIKKIALGI